MDENSRVNLMLIRELHIRWKSPKLSSWYAVGLLARQGEGDVELANQLISNIITQQYTDPSFIGYGTYVCDSSILIPLSICLCL